MSLLRLPPIDPAPARPLRRWQGIAVPSALDAIERRARGIIVAVTGSGKSVALAEVIAQVLLRGAQRVVVTTSSRRLVEQLAGTIGERIGPGRVGRYYTSAKEADRQVVVCCGASALGLAAVFRRYDWGVDLWIADEAHRTEAEGLTVAAGALRPVAALGFTATAFRSDEDETLRMFTEVVHRYGFREALSDGVIVPWRVVPWTGADLPLDEAVLQMIRTHTEGPGVVNAVSIEDAERHSAWLTERGVPAAAVHSQLAQPTQDSRLAALRRGELRCIVYPSLLSEGADFPWLRWSCLRREVKARVRFIQETGRVLRTHPGKTEAVILDPLGLFNSLALAYDEELGEPPPAQPSVSLRGGGGGGGGGPEAAAMARASDVVASWARQLYLSAQLDGIVQPRERMPASREDVATQQQLGAIKKLFWARRWLPDTQQPVVSFLAVHQDMPNRGSASDLLDVLSALAKRREPWDPTLPVHAPPLEVLEALQHEVDAGDWYAAGALRDGCRAIAILQGRRIVEAQAILDPAESHPAAVHIAAARRAARHAGEGATIRVCHELAHRVLTGVSRVSHPAVDAALVGIVPKVTWALVLPRECPAQSMAWRELHRMAGAT